MKNPTSHRPQPVAAHTPSLPIGIYSPSNAPEHVRIIDGSHFTLFDSQNADVWPMSVDTRAFIVRACNAHAGLVEALRKALLLVEKAKPYVQQHACLTADDMRGLGGDVGDSYWLEIAEKWTPELSAALQSAKEAQ